MSDVVTLEAQLQLRVKLYIVDKFTEWQYRIAVRLCTLYCPNGVGSYKKIISKILSVFAVKL